MKSVIAAALAFCSLSLHAATLDITPGENIYRGAGFYSPVIGKAIQFALEDLMRDSPDFYTTTDLQVGRSVIDNLDLPFTGTTLHVYGHLLTCTEDGQEANYQGLPPPPDITKLSIDTAGEYWNQILAVQEANDAETKKREEFLNKCGLSVQADGFCDVKMHVQAKSWNPFDEKIYTIEMNPLFCPAMRRFSNAILTFTLERASDTVVHMSEIKKQL